MKPGDMALHPIHGMGIILEEWGSWWACANCYAPATDGCQCLTTVPPIQISGRGTFDVEFKDGKTRSINKRLLTPILKFGHDSGQIGVGHDAPSSLNDLGIRATKRVLSTYSLSRANDS